MQNIPLHPLIVHFPIALATLAPVLALFLVVSFWRRRDLPRAWGLLTVLLALVLAGGLAATRTGGAEERRVEPFVGEAALEAHEELGESFLPVAGAVLAVAAAVPLFRGRRALCRGLAVLCLAGTVALTVLTVRIGHSGGELVYVRGAARAYAQDAPLPRAALAVDHDGDGPLD